MWTNSGSVYKPHWPIGRWLAASLPDPAAQEAAVVGFDLVARIALEGLAGIVAAVAAAAVAVDIAAAAGPAKALHAGVVLAQEYRGDQAGVACPRVHRVRVRPSIQARYGAVCRGLRAATSHARSRSQVACGKPGRYCCEKKRGGHIGNGSCARPAKAVAGLLGVGRK